MTRVPFLWRPSVDQSARHFQGSLSGLKGLPHVFIASPRIRLRQGIAGALLALALGAWAQRAEDGKLDLNTASAQQLAALPGMGREYVKRVIAGRPYTAKNQLATRGILPQGAYLKLADRVVAHRSKPPVEK